MKTETLIFTRVASDINGNPRYSVDGYDLLTAAERASLPDSYNAKDEARKRANSIGGRKARGAFAFIFQSYSVQATADAIGHVTGRAFIAEKG